MTAKINDLPQPDDDTIPVVCGLPLIDADPAVIARRLSAAPWEDRFRLMGYLHAEPAALCAGGS